MKMRTTISIALSVAFLLLASTAFAGPGCGGRGTRITLTEDQMELLHTTKAEMIESGASPEEIRAALRDLLDGFGIEMPEARGSTKGGGGCHGSGGHSGCDGSDCDHAPGECDKSCDKPGGRAGCHGSGSHSGCDGSDCDHAPGECDKSCDKPDGRAGCHGSGGGHASGGCCSEATGDKNVTSEVGEDNQNIPTRVKIGNIIPNPFNASVEIKIEGKPETARTLDIIDVQGRVVRALPIMGTSVHWDGTDSGGRALNSGTYFARVTGTTESKKIILMK